MRTNVEHIARNGALPSLCLPPLNNYNDNFTLRKVKGKEGEKWCSYCSSIGRRVQKKCFSPVVPDFCGSCSSISSSPGAALGARLKARPTTERAQRSSRLLPRCSCSALWG